ncbi:MAG: serine hydrolase domain-containing protein [Pseudomonadales bacterium]
MTKLFNSKAASAIDECLRAPIEGGIIHGLSAAIVSDTEVHYENAFGTRASDGTTTMTTDTVMAIMSMTKALTGAAAMQLVEQGKLALDGPAANVCPELGALQVLEGFSEDGAARLRPARSAITLRQLLTHTSGLAYPTWNAALLRYATEHKIPDISTLQKASLQLPLMFDPGTDWEYGIGIDWVGQMVEAASGLTLGAYFAEYLTGPLAMSSTGFSATPDMLQRMAPIHKRTKNGALKPLAPNVPASPEFEMGGGGLLSTVQDYGRFVRMILGNGALEGVRVLSEASVEMMAQNQMGNLRVKPLPTAIPILSNDAEFFPGEPKSWGLTFQISETDCDTGRKAGTLMWAGLANSYYWIDRTSNLAGIYLTQIFPFVDEHALAHYYEFESAAYTHRDHRP